jgi:hypothetical protein
MPVRCGWLKKEGDLPSAAHSIMQRCHVLAGKAIFWYLRGAIECCALPVRFAVLGWGCLE